jgi:GT2 family glycosyltransferase
MRRWGDLCAAVAAVRAQLSSADELIVVVDHNDELLEVASRSFVGATVVSNRVARGLSGARNTGLTLVANDIIVFIDDDAIPAPGMVDVMVDAMRSPHVAAVGGAPEPVFPSGRRPWWFPPEFDWVVGCAYVGLPERRAEVRNVIGACMAFRRNVFTEVGVFRTEVGRVGTLPVGCEETELCIRIRQRFPEAVIEHLPEAKVAHRVTEDRTTWRYFLRRCFGEGVSKAEIGRFVGKADALASERRYVVNVLPRAAGLNVAKALTGCPAAAGRATAIVSGLAATSLGYGWRIASGVVVRRLPRRGRTTS